MGGGSTKTSTKTASTQTPQVPGWISQPYQGFANSVGALGQMNPQDFATPASALQQRAWQFGGTGNPTQGGYDATRGLLDGPDVQAGQLSNTDYSQYMNPWQSNVIDATIGDWSHGNDLALNALRASGNQSGAFNNDRLGLAEGQLLGDNSRTLASTLANLRAGGFQNAQQAAQFDIGNRFSADQFNRNFKLGAANQLSNIGLLGANNARADTQLMNDMGGQQRQVALNNNPAVLAAQLLQTRGGLLGMIPTGTFTGQNMTGTSTSTQKTNPGFLDYLSGIGNFMGSVSGFKLPFG